jgi:ribosome biogenesis GTPase
MVGTILFGINNIYTVHHEDGREYLCRIKGKILGGSKSEYNPLAPGDLVEFEMDEHESGSIIKRLPRKNMMTRYNKKRMADQVLAANLDGVICVCSPDKPPFRPTFIDRVILSAGHIPVTILLNKIDQEISERVEQRLGYFRKIGHEIYYSNAKTGEGIEKLKALLSQGQFAFVGQSGVGKSSVLNHFAPDRQLKIGEISEKYNRGKHTTNYALMFQWSGGWLVDTPGVREIEISGIQSYELASYYEDFVHLGDSCSMVNCTHIHEPGCVVQQAVAQGDVPLDRYEGYKKLYSELVERENRYFS